MSINAKAEDFGMTAQYWKGDVESLLGRLASRKYNGHSVIWDGGITEGLTADQVSWYTKGGDKVPPKCSGLWSLGRNGVVKVVQAPPMWVKRLPKGVPLHGELWYNDDTEYLKKHCKVKSPNFLYWNPVKFIIFSVKPYSTFPGLGQASELVNSRFWSNDVGQGDLLARAKSEVETNNTVSFVEHTIINSRQQALELIESFYTDKNNWEGYMFLDPKSKYEGKRSWGVLKFKPTFEDEATVTLRL